MNVLKSLAAYYAEMMSEVTTGGPAQLDTGPGRNAAIRDAISLHDLVSLLDLRESGTSKLVVQQPPATENLTAEDVDDPENVEPPVPSPAEQAWRRLRHIVGEAATNPYERELVLAFPYIIGTGPAGTRLRAPLYFWRVQAEEDLATSEIRLVGLEEPVLSPKLTSHLVGEDPHESSTLRAAITQLTGYEPFTRLDEVAKLLARLVDSVRPEFIAETLVAPQAEGRGLRVVAVCELLLVTKANYFVVDNLRELAETDDDELGASALGAVVDPTAFDEPADEDAERQAAEAILATPFPSNEAQRRILARSNAKLLAVTGPPGTGKSQTIANLVCRLVARGQRVLVTSQKTKALEVVAKKLAELEIGYLAMALLGGDTEAKRALTDAIANLAEQTSGLLPSRLEEAWQRTRIELEDLAAERRYSVRLFNQLAQIEHNAGPLVEKYQPGAEHDVLGAAPVDLDSVNAATAAEVVRTITEELLAGGPATDMLQAGQPALERSAELEKIATIRAALLSSHPKFTTGEPLPVPWATAAALLTALERAAALARLLPLEIRATADELRGLPTAVRDHALQTLKDVLARATSVDPADRTAFTARDPLSVLVGAFQVWERHGRPRHGLLPSTREAAALLRRTAPELFTDPTGQVLVRFRA